MIVTEKDNKEFSERRKCPRARLKLWVHYKTIHQGKISSTLESLTDDLSAGGVRLRADHQVIQGQMLMLTLYLPQEENLKEIETTMIYRENDCMPISILARVAWCQADEDDEFSFGVQFIELDDYSRSILRLYLEHYQLFSKESSIFNHYN